MRDFNSELEKLLLHLIENAVDKGTAVVTSLELELDGVTWKEARENISDAYEDLLKLKQLGYISSLSDAGPNIVIFLERKALNYES